jgi:hypothetical protein
MKRSKMLLAAVASGAVLSAAAVPTAMAMTGPKTQVANQGSPNNASDPGKGQQCGYPSNRAPAATLSAKPDRVARGQNVVLSGTLTSNKCSISSTPVGLYTRAANGTLTKVAEVLTDASGAFTFPVQKPLTTTTYVAISQRTQFYDSASSSPVTVTVR